MIDYEAVKHWQFADVINEYSQDDVILYALSLGMAEDPFDESDLGYVVEDDLRVVPTLLATVGAPGAWATDPKTGIDWMQILHGEHRMRFDAALAPSGKLLSRTRVSGIVDKGVGKGALVTTEREVLDADSGRRVAYVEHVSFCRADGGYSTMGRACSDAPLPALQAAPTSAHDVEIEMGTRRNAALLYRLNGDRNPIHALPQVWRNAGFEQPILHGLCTYGMAARGLLRLVCGNAPQRLASIAARFSAPVIPGETLILRVWHGMQDPVSATQAVHFEVWVRERQCKVLSHGVAEIRMSAE